MILMSLWSARSTYVHFKKRGTMTLDMVKARQAAGFKTIYTQQVIPGVTVYGHVVPCITNAEGQRLYHAIYEGRLKHEGEEVVYFARDLVTSDGDKHFTHPEALETFQEMTNLLLDDLKRFPPEDHLPFILENAYLAEFLARIANNEDENLSDTVLRIIVGDVEKQLKDAGLPTLDDEFRGLFGPN